MMLFNSLIHLTNLYKCHFWARSSSMHTNYYPQSSAPATSSPWRASLLSLSVSCFSFSSVVFNPCNLSLSFTHTHTHTHTRTFVYAYFKLFVQWFFKIVQHTVNEENSTMNILIPRFTNILPYLFSLPQLFCVHTLYVYR